MTLLPAEREVAGQEEEAEQAAAEMVVVVVAAAAVATAAEEEERGEGHSNEGSSAGHGARARSSSSSDVVPAPPHCEGRSCGPGCRGSRRGGTPRAAACPTAKPALEGDVALR